MLKNTSTDSRGCRFTALRIALGLTLLTAVDTGALPTSDSQASCRSPLPLTVNETWRAPNGDVGEVHCFEIDVVTSGILTFDLSTPGSSTGNPRLASFEIVEPYPSVTGLNSKVFTVIKHSAASAILAVEEPGSYRLRVAAADLRQALAGYKLRVGFRKDSTRGEDDDELEPDPDPKSACRPGFTRGEDDDELEPDPDPRAACRPGSNRGEDDDELEPDPDPRAADPYDFSTIPTARRVLLEELCQTGEADDHGDTLACATPLHSRSTTGEIDNGWGDDEDVFRFRLDAPRTVEIATDGSTEILSELIDRFGNRLGNLDESRLVRTLAPGTYFVRVAGHLGASGPYRLQVQTLP